MEDEEIREEKVALIHARSPVSLGIIALNDSTFHDLCPAPMLSADAGSSVLYVALWKVKV